MEAPLSNESSYFDAHAESYDESSIKAIRFLVRIRRFLPERGFPSWPRARGDSTFRKLVFSILAAGWGHLTF
jgi:hypothetical protein